jgi:hypothetical protein
MSDSSTGQLRVRFIRKLRIEPTDPCTKVNNDSFAEACTDSTETDSNTNSNLSSEVNTTNKTDDPLYLTFSEPLKVGLDSDDSSTDSTSSSTTSHDEHDLKNDANEESYVDGHLIGSTIEDETSVMDVITFNRKQPIARKRSLSIDNIPSSTKSHKSTTSWDPSSHAIPNLDTSTSNSSSSSSAATLDSKDDSISNPDDPTLDDAFVSLPATPPRRSVSSPILSAVSRFGNQNNRYFAHSHGHGQVINNPASLEEATTTISQAGSLRIKSLSQNSSKKRTPKRTVSLHKSVSVIPIPTREEYSLPVRERIWSSSSELCANAARNSVEYASEGWNWRTVLEENQMLLHKTSGELIHPIHLHNALISQTHSQPSNNAAKHEDDSIQLMEELLPNLSPNVDGNHLDEYSSNIPSWAKSVLSRVLNKH